MCLGYWVRLPLSIREKEGMDGWYGRKLWKEGMEGRHEMELWKDGRKYVGMEERHGSKGGIE